MKRFFTLKGRLNRLRYFKYSILLFLLLAVFITLSIIATVGAEKSDSSFLLLLALICFLCGVAVFWGTVAVSVRRLHDLNLSGWWYGLVFLISTVGSSLAMSEDDAVVLAATILNLATVSFSFYLFLKKGTEGTNDYGEDLLKPKN